MKTRQSTTRRDFARLAMGAAALPALATAASEKLRPLAAGIKITLQIPTNPAADDFQFANQLGVKYVSIPSGGDNATADNYIRWKEAAEAAGLRVWNIGNSNVHNMPEVTLNLPGRDRKIEEYKNYLRSLAKAGIYYTTYAHMANGIWSTDPETTRGGAPVRAFNEAKGGKGYWMDKVYAPPLSHGRRYSKEEIWENYTYFIRQVAPVAEESGIRIGIHPDDPPVPELAGVPRCIFGNFEGYVRALEIANSPNVGVCLCCGTWLEGGKLMGKDVLEAARFFAKQDKLWKIHFRNVSAPLPYFVESFVDNGYMDMYKIMRTLVEVDFRGCVIADHVPAMVGGPNVGWAYSIAWIRAMHARALA